MSDKDSADQDYAEIQGGFFNQLALDYETLKSDPVAWRLERREEELWDRLPDDLLPDG